MPFREVAGIFSNEDLSVMRDAYELACDELGITLEEGDRGKREQVASLIIQFAQGGERNAAVLHRLTVLRVLKIHG